MSESQTDRQKRFQELFLETLSNHYFEYFNLKTDQELLDDLHYGAYTTEGHVARKAYSLLKKEEEESQQKKEKPGSLDPKLLKQAGKDIHEFILKEAVKKSAKTLVAGTSSVVQEPPKERWRAEMGEVYYIIAMDLEVYAETEDQSIIDDLNWSNGNYFRTKKQAEAAAQKVKDLLLSLHYS